MGSVFNNNYKLFDKLDAFSFFIIRMLYTYSNIPKSIIYSALVGEFLRIVSLWNCLIEWNHRQHNLRWRKALSKIIQRQKNVCQFQKKLRWNSFWRFYSNYIKFAIWHMTLSATLSSCYIYFWCMTLSAVSPFSFTQFLSNSSFSLTHYTLSTVFCPICYTWNVRLKRYEIFVVFMFYF